MCVYSNRETKLKKKTTKLFLMSHLLSKMTFSPSFVLYRWLYNLLIHHIKKCTLTLTDFVLIPDFPKLSCSLESLQRIISALRLMKSPPWLRCTRGLSCICRAPIHGKGSLLGIALGTLTPAVWSPYSGHLSVCCLKDLYWFPLLIEEQHEFW